MLALSLVACSSTIETPQASPADGGTSPMPAAESQAGPECTPDALAVAVQAAGIAEPKSVRNLTCVEDWATADVISVTTGGTDSLSLFHAVDGSWTYVSDVVPPCVSELVREGAPKDVAEQLGRLGDLLTYCTD